MKKLCPTHHLFFSDNECPLCRQERIERYGHKFCSQTTVNTEQKKAKDDRLITEDDINKLVSKFNNKNKCKSN